MKNEEHYKELYYDLVAFLDLINVDSPNFINSAPEVQERVLIAKQIITNEKNQTPKN